MRTVLAILALLAVPSAPPVSAEFVSSPPPIERHEPAGLAELPRPATSTPLTLDHDTGLAELGRRWQESIRSVVQSMPGAREMRTADVEAEPSLLPLTWGDVDGDGLADLALLAVADEEDEEEQQIRFRSGADGRLIGSVRVGGSPWMMAGDGGDCWTGCFAMSMRMTFPAPIDDRRTGVYVLTTRLEEQGLFPSAIEEVRAEIGVAAYDGTGARRYAVTRSGTLRRTPVSTSADRFPSLAGIFRADAAAVPDFLLTEEHGRTSPLRSDRTLRMSVLRGGDGAEAPSGIELSHPVAGTRVSAVGDLDRDGQGDVVLTASDSPIAPRWHATAYSVTSGRPLWDATDLPGSDVVVFGALDGDGVDDLLVWPPRSASFTLLSGADGTVLAEPSQLAYTADVDGDGVLELATYEQETDDGVFVVDLDFARVDGTPVRKIHRELPLPESRHGGPMTAGLGGIGDVDADGLPDFGLRVAEVVSEDGEGATSEGPWGPNFRFEERYVDAMATDGSVLWSNTTLFPDPARVSFTGRGDDFVHLDEETDVFQVVDGATGTQRWARPVVGRPIRLSATGDDCTDLAVLDGSELRLLDGATGAPVWHVDVSRPEPAADVAAASGRCGHGPDAAAGVPAADVADTADESVAADEAPAAEEPAAAEESGAAGGGGDSTGGAGRGARLLGSPGGTLAGTGLPPALPLVGLPLFGLAVAFRRRSTS